MSEDIPLHPSDIDPAREKLLEQIELLWQVLESGEREQALALAIELSREYPEDGNVALALTAANYEAGFIRATLFAAMNAGELGADDNTLRLWYLAASHHFLWKFHLSRRVLEKLLNEEEDFPEAWFLLAQVYEMEGNEIGARRGYEKAHGLEPDRFPRPRKLEDSAILAGIDAARESLPPRFAKALEDLTIVIEEIPSPDVLEKVKTGSDPVPPDVLGLYLGKRSDLESETLCLYRKNLERLSASDEELAEELRLTFWYEISHYLGLDDEHFESLETD